MESPLNFPIKCLAKNPEIPPLLLHVPSFSRIGLEWGKVGFQPRFWVGHNAFYGFSSFVDYCNLLGESEGCSHSCHQLWSLGSHRGQPTSQVVQLLSSLGILSSRHLAPVLQLAISLLPTPVGDLLPSLLLKHGRVGPLGVTRVGPSSCSRHSPGPSAAACLRGRERNSCWPDWAAGFFPLLRTPVVLAPQGSRAMALEWSRDTTAGGHDPSSCVQSLESGKGLQHLPSIPCGPQTLEASGFGSFSPPLKPSVRVNHSPASFFFFF